MTHLVHACPLPGHILRHVWNVLLSVSLFLLKKFFFPMHSDTMSSILWFVFFYELSINYILSVLFNNFYSHEFQIKKYFFSVFPPHFPYFDFFRIIVSRVHMWISVRVCAF